MKAAVKSKEEESLLRKNFDSFTPRQKLDDAHEEFIEAIYRYREAENEGSPDLLTLKREMEFLDRKVMHYRYCVYSGLAIDGEYVEEVALNTACLCPNPAWI